MRFGYVAMRINKLCALSVSMGRVLGELCAMPPSHPFT